MKEEIKRHTKTLIGLFIPLKWKHEDGDRWGGSFAVSHIPIGLIMIAIAVVVNLIMN